MKIIHFYSMDRIQAFLMGDKTAFGELFTQARPDLLTFARTLSLEHPEDLLHDTYLHLSEKDLTGMNPDKFNFRGFFIRCMRNYYFDSQRVENRMRMQSWEFLPEPADSGPYIETDYSLLFQTIDTLSPNLKQVMELRFAGMRFKEIACLLGLSVNTLTGRFRYGRLQINKVLELSAD